MEIGKSLSFLKKIVLFGLLATIVCSCANKSEDPFMAMKFNPYDQSLGKRIAAYHQSKMPNNANLKSGNPSLYIDFSSGINKAFNEAAIKGLMNNCFNTVLAEKFDVYKLGNHQITALDVENTTELGQQVSDAKQYQDIWAPIQAAVEKIVAGHNDALLITDFEEWQGNQEVTNTAFLKIPFSKWLAQGNSIHFFIADYTEGKVNKHLYFTVFNCGNQNASSMISKLESKLAPFTTRFDLSKQAYQLHTAYSPENSGGIFYDLTAKTDRDKNVLDLKNGYLNGLKNGDHFEFYPFGLDWESIAQLRRAYTSQNQFNDFFRKLFIDLSNEDSYTFADLDVKVSDVTADFENFSKAEEVKYHKPKLTKGDNGETKFSPNETDLIALNCYQSDGKLKEKWVYKPLSPVSINEVFVLNKTLFANTKSASKKNVEIGVSFDPKFSEQHIQNSDGIVRVDVVVITAIPKLTGAKIAKFQWVNAKRIANVALAESIQTTLQELKPTDQIVYSYYIKTKQ